MTRKHYQQNAFYATVQNKLHDDVHGYTAAELIVGRANATKEHIGLTAWKDATDGKTFLETEMPRFFNSSMISFVESACSSSVNFSSMSYKTNNLIALSVFFAMVLPYKLRLSGFNRKSKIFINNTPLSL